MWESASKHEEKQIRGASVQAQVNMNAQARGLVVDSVATGANLICEDISRSLCRLQEAADRLEHRLAPLLRMEEKVVCTGDCRPNRDMLPPLWQEIGCMIDGHNMAMDRIDAMLGRLEL